MKPVERGARRGAAYAVPPRGRMARPCPRCGARPGWRCTRTVGVQEIPIKKTHPERTEGGAMSKAGRAALAITALDQAITEGRAWLKANGHTGHKDRGPEWFEALTSAVDDLIEQGPISREDAHGFYGEER